MKKFLVLLTLFGLLLSTASYGECCGNELDQNQLSKEINECPHHQTEQKQTNKKSEKEKKSCLKICCLNLVSVRPINILKKSETTYFEIQLTYHGLNTSTFVDNLLRPPIA